MDWFKNWLKRLCFAIVEKEIRDFRLNKEELKQAVYRQLQALKGSVADNELISEVLDTLDDGLSASQSRMRSVVLAETGDLGPTIVPFVDELYEKANAEIKEVLTIEQYNDVMGGNISGLVADAIVDKEGVIKEAVIKEIRDRFFPARTTTY